MEDAMNGMPPEVVNHRKTVIRGLRKSLEWTIENGGLTDRVMSKIYDLLDHIGRPGDPIEPQMIGADKWRNVKPPPAPVPE